MMRNVGMYERDKSSGIVRSKEAQIMFDFRLSNNMTMEELFRRTGICAQTLRNFENRTKSKPVQWMIWARCKGIGLDFPGCEIGIPHKGKFIRNNERDLQINKEPMVFKCEPIKAPSSMLLIDDYKKLILSYKDIIKSSEDRILLEMEKVEKMKDVLKMMTATLTKMEDK
jgi:hypothetical protein